MQPGRIVSAAVVAIMSTEKYEQRTNQTAEAVPRKQEHRADRSTAGIFKGLLPLEQCQRCSLLLRIAIHRAVWLRAGQRQSMVAHSSCSNVTYVLISRWFKNAKIKNKGQK